eukprot:7099050-Pyramimonas_sp.AAC.2
MLLVSSLEATNRMFIGIAQQLVAAPVSFLVGSGAGKVVTFHMLRVFLGTVSAACEVNYIPHRFAVIRTPPTMGPARTTCYISLMQGTVPHSIATLPLALGYVYPYQSTNL